MQTGEHHGNLPGEKSTGSFQYLLDEEDDAMLQLDLDF